MSRYDSARLLTPPREEEEVYPYRRVWPSIILEVGILFGVTFAVFSLDNFLGIGLPLSVQQPVSIALALLPAVLWAIFSRWRENFAPEPRIQLFQVFILSLLVANAVSIPLINSLGIDVWLSPLETVDRMIGYTVSVGIIHEILKYTILRYTIWPDRLRNRTDAIAYAAACSVGYATILNLHLISEGLISPDVIAARVFANTTLQLAAGTIVAYGLAEVRFNPRSLIIMPVTLFFAAVVQGLGISVRPNLISSGFALGIAFTRPLFGFGFALIIVVAVLFVMSFLFQAREREEEQSVTAPKSGL